MGVDPVSGLDQPLDGVGNLQLTPRGRFDGVDRVKIRDKSGKEGWVTPDARPLKGQVYFEREGGEVPWASRREAEGFTLERSAQTPGIISANLPNRLIALISCISPVPVSLAMMR